MRPYVCKRCGPVDRVYTRQQFDKRNGRTHTARWCKSCKDSKNEDWNAGHRDSKRGMTRKAMHRYRRNHPGYSKALNKKNRSRLSGCRIVDFSAQQWNLLKLVFNNRCAYCLAVSNSLTQDHIVPISKSGNHTLTNIVPSCLPCNLAKGTQTWKPLLKFGTYA